MASSLQTMIRDLGRRRGRERRSLALAEGVRLVEEALAAGVPFQGAAVSPALEATTRGMALKGALAAEKVRLEEVSDRELTALADTEHPQGVVAVIQPRQWKLDDIPVKAGAVVLVLDAVQDPGNVGTMLRTSFALGAAGVVALKGTAELTNPKVLRGSMGALFRHPAVAADIGEFLSWSKSQHAELWVTASDGEPIRQLPVRHHPLRGYPARPPVCLVLGNEGAGISPELEAVSARRTAIPLAPNAESLNVAVAAGILLYEITRVD
jgi:RNA methyltransferase, TrmH family